MRRLLTTTAILSFGLALGLPGAAHAFCGFYVSGAGTDMFNNATQVVMMREGTRTVLSMQNNYQGPPSDFAMVVPVPVVLQKDNVKTLDKAVFKRVDQLAAPRLVEYWEQDPCAPVVRYQYAMKSGAAGGMRRSRNGNTAADLGVTIEARFKVGEYEIAILSARDSTGLDTWLRQEKYKIPAGAEPLLKPYVEAGSKFFVAKVDVEKVKFNSKGMADLSPLRFHYDTTEFSLPVRLGLINSGGTQDLIVHILAKGKRYEVANYKNVTIPTNLDVKDQVRERFGEFYAALFDATVEMNPGAVVTEYSWDASSCDPCPTPALGPDELATLGLDVVDAAAGATTRPPARGRGRRMGWGAVRGFVLTRLHVRYGKNDLANDLVFKEAGAIAGGREFVKSEGKLEEGAQPASVNNFQARYAIRHEWTGAIECESPRRGIWGGPPAGVDGTTRPRPALDLAFAPRGQARLASFVTGEVPGIDLDKVGKQAVAPTTTTQEPAQAGQGVGQDNADAPPTPDPATQPRSKTSRGCDAAGAPGPGAFLLLLIVGAVLLVRRRVRGFANNHASR